MMTVNRIVEIVVVKCSGFGVVAKSMQPEGRSQERMSEHDEQETEGDGKAAGAHGRAQLVRMAGPDGDVDGACGHMVLMPTVMPKLMNQCPVVRIARAGGNSSDDNGLDYHGVR